MKCLLVVCAFIGLAVADDTYKGDGHSKNTDSYSQGGYEVKSYGSYSSQTYHGKYPGKCENDGFYYHSDYSFMICSNGNAYEQKCAPGSRNSGYDHFNYGDKYHSRDFCDVNLVDYGYGAHKGYGSYNGGYHGNNYGQGYGHENRGYGYGDSSYGHGGRYGYNDGYHGDRGYGYGGDYRGHGRGYAY